MEDTVKANYIYICLMFFGTENKTIYTVVLCTC